MPDGSVKKSLEDAAEALVFGGLAKRELEGKLEPPAKRTTWLGQLVGKISGGDEDPELHPCGKVLESRAVVMPGKASDRSRVVVKKFGYVMSRNRGHTKAVCSLGFRTRDNESDLAWSAAGDGRVCVFSVRADAKELINTLSLSDASITDAVLASSRERLFCLTDSASVLSVHLETQQADKLAPILAPLGTLNAQQSQFATRTRVCVGQPGSRSAASAVFETSTHRAPAFRALSAADNALLLLDAAGRCVYHIDERVGRVVKKFFANHTLTSLAPLPGSRLCLAGDSLGYLLEFDLGMGRCSARTKLPGALGVQTLAVDHSNKFVFAGDVAGVITQYGLQPQLPESNGSTVVRTYNDETPSPQTHTHQHTHTSEEGGGSPRTPVSVVKTYDQIGLPATVLVAHPTQPLLFAAASNSDVAAPKLINSAHKFVYSNWPHKTPTPLTAAAFSGRNGWFLTGADNGIVKLWQFPEFS